MNTSSNLKKILSHNFWSFAVMKSNLLVTPWADFPDACEAFWTLARSAYLMLPAVTLGNWTALPPIFYFFRRLSRSMSKLLQIPKLHTGGLYPTVALQAESKADLLNHLLSEGQNALGTPWSLSELDKLCFFLHWGPDLGGIENLWSKKELLLLS